MNLFLTIFLGFLFTSFPGDKTGEKAQTEWVSFEEGIERAKKSNKKVMVDVYTDWCGWCKKLDKEVYANSDVAKYLGDKYISIKLNAESGQQIKFQGKTYTAQQLSQAFGATGYPTIVFLKSNSEMITNIGGYVEAGRFLKILKFLGEDHYEKMKWEEYNAKEEKASKKK